MFIYQLARNLNKKIKQRRKENAGRFLSPVRRIERVAKPISGRFVAMTFDDGPSGLAPVPYKENTPLTTVLLDILKTYEAKGTFDVIGTTGENYPDEVGKLHAFTWGGKRFDHYPDIHEDDLGGAVALPALIDRMVQEGHEIANHGYWHRLFGPMKLVYGQRISFENVNEVVDDLQKLHQLIATKHQYNMRLSRPPHYIDKIKDGYNAYDAYKRMGYNYLAASFDGGGWMASSGDYKTDVEKMIAPLRNALREDEDSLNGQIIFQKDGCNMSKETPVADALGEHLRLLTNAGYQVITVSELMAMSPFEDDIFESDYTAYIRELATKNYCIGYQNNTFQKNRILTLGELIMMTAHPSAYLIDYGDKRKNESMHQAITWHKEKGFITGDDDYKRIISGKDLLNLAEQQGIALEHTQWANHSEVKRQEAMELLAKLAR